MNKNEVAGVQPKTMAIVSDKGQLESREYIIKTWGQEFPWLAENEYFSMRSMQKAGVIIPKIYISINRRFLIVEKFTIDSKGKVFGFEEVLSLMGKTEYISMKEVMSRLQKLFTREQIVMSFL